MIKNIILTAIIGSLSFIASAKSIVSTVKVDTVLTHENVTYTVTSDENNFHVNVSTTDEKTMMSMLRLGVSVFFDIKGKKKQNVYVRYPSEPMQRQRPQGRPDESGRSGRPEATSFEEDEAKRKKRITDILEKDYSQNAVYGYFDDTEEFHILMNTVGIDVAFTYNEEEPVLEYNLILPKNKINTDVNKDLSKLTIGIETIKAKSEGKNGEGISGSLGGFNLGGQQGGGRSGGGQGGPPGGGRGGNSNQGGQGGQRGNRPNTDNSNRANDVMLDFWFAVNK